MRYKMKMLLLVLALFANTAFAQLLSADSSRMVNLNMIGRINQAKGVNLVVGASGLVDLNSVAGNLVHIAAGGSTIISSLGSASQTGLNRRVIFDGVQSLVYSATLLVVPGASNITTAAGDSAIFYADTISNAVPPVTKWVMLNYTRQVTAP